MRGEVELEAFRDNLWAGTMARHGSVELKSQFLDRLLTGKLPCCLLYSEPGAGSDLAGLRTRAELDGDTYVVNGQKVWTSGAHVADFAMLIARTNWDVPKHQGITFFWFPMKQHGVEVRPLRQITGAAHFNEVFLTDARVPLANVLGSVDCGWQVLQTALAIERSIMGRERDSAPAGDHPGSTQPGSTQPGSTQPASTGPGSTRIAERLVELAGERGGVDPVVRDQIARVYAMQAVNQWTAMRAQAESGRHGSSPLVSLGKLGMSRLRHFGAIVQSRLIGAVALLDGVSSELGAESTFLSL